MSVPSRISLPLAAAAAAALALAAPAALAADGPSYGARTVVGVGVGVSDPRSLVAADLDEDGRPDLVAGDRNGDQGRVSVLRNLGNLTFAAPLGGPFDPGLAGSGVGDIAVGDVNGDGRPDVLAALATGATDDQLVPLAGDGTGRLTAGAPVTTRGALSGVALGDLDLDGRLDALTSHAAGVTSQELAVLRNGAGGLVLDASYGATATSVAAGLAVGQLDGQGGADALVISRNAGSGSAWVARSGGLGLTAGLPVALGGDPVAVALADVDGDGDLDGLVLDGATGVLTVLRNDGAGTLSPSTVSVAGLVDGSGLAAGDLNGDGRADAVVTDQTTDRAGVLLGDGHGGFGSPSWQAMGSGTRAPVIADLDGDGVPDLATADGHSATISVRRGTSAAAPRALGAPAGLELGTQVVATTGAPRTVTIANAGQARLEVRDVSVTGRDADDFLVTRDTCAGSAVRSGGTDTCAVNVRFAPSASGTRTAALRLRHAGGTLLVALTGSGADAPATTAAPSGSTATRSTTPAGAPGGPGQPSGARRARLVLTLDRTKLRAAGGAPVALRYAVGRAAHLVLRVKHGARTVEIVRADAREGRGTLTWDGRLGRAPAPAGTYRLALHAVAADGAAARASAALRVRA